MAANKNGSQIKAGAILSYCQIVLGIVINLIYTPVMLRILGQSEYGLYNTVASTISTLSLLNLGFSSGYIRYYSRYKQENSQERISSLNGLYLVIFLIIGLIAFLCGFYLTTHLELVFAKGLTIAEYEIAKELMLLLTINLVVSFPMTVFSCFITAQERFVFIKTVNLIKTVFSPLLTVPVLLLGYGSIGMVITTVVLSLIADGLLLFYSFQCLNMRIVFHDFEKGIFLSLLAYSLFIAINSIVDQINWNVDKVLLGRYKGTSSVSVYTVGYSIYNYYMSMSTAIAGVLTPKVHRLIAGKASGKEISDLFIKVGRIQMLCLGLIVSGFVLWGRWFVKMWAGKEYDSAYVVALLLMIPATIPLIQNLGIEIQRAQNKHYFRSIIYLFMAGINFSISVVLCQKWGPTGSAFGTALSLIVANGMIMNIYYSRACGIEIIRFWKSILRLMVGMVIPFFCGSLMRYYWRAEGIESFAVQVAMYSCIYMVSMWFFGMNDAEKEMVRKIWRRLCLAR